MFEVVWFAWKYYCSFCLHVGLMCFTSTSFVAFDGACLRQVRPGHVTSGGGKRGGGGGKKGGSSSSSTSSSSTTTTPPAAKLDMITRFVRLHGMLFTKTGFVHGMCSALCIRPIHGDGG